MTDSKKYKDWQDKAKADLKSAKILFEYEADCGIVAFHCQQAIEKLLKAFILKQSNEITEGHSLIYLCKKASEYDINNKKLLKDCAYINQFYIETRYPSDIPLEMTRDEAEECIKMSDDIFAEIEVLL